MHIEGTIKDLIQKYHPQLAERELQDEIADVGKLISAKDGDILMEIGSYVKYMPIIISGSIKVFREDEEGREIFLYYISKGDSCPMSFTCCMMYKKSEIRTVADEDTTIVGIPNRYMDEWLRKYQSWKNFIMISYENRLKELLNTIDSIAFQKMDQRLLTYLSSKAATKDTKMINTTHQQIANDLNASRETISRLLKQLERDGEVELGRNKIKLVQ